jgi:hypothetical protein
MFSKYFTMIILFLYHFPQKMHINRTHRALSVLRPSALRPALSALLQTVFFNGSFAVAAYGAYLYYRLLQTVFFNGLRHSVLVV